MTDTTVRDVESAIVEILERAPRSARFVTELAQALQRANVGAAALERELGKLEASGRVLVREQFCGDPHLEGADLRIVALVRTPPGGAMLEGLRLRFIGASPLSRRQVSRRI